MIADGSLAIAGGLVLTSAEPELLDIIAAAARLLPWSRWASAGDDRPATRS